MPIRQVMRAPIPERTTQRLDAVIEDEAGTPIAGTALTTLTLTLYALDASKTIINNRNRQNILGTNGGSVDANGNLVLILGPLDNSIVDTTIPVDGIEEHVALFEYTWDAGSKHGKQEVLIKVVNIEKVP